MASQNFDSRTLRKTYRVLLEHTAYLARKIFTELAYENVQSLVKANKQLDHYWAARELGRTLGKINKSEGQTNYDKYCTGTNRDEWVLNTYTLVCMRSAECDQEMKSDDSAEEVAFRVWFHSCALLGEHLFSDPSMYSSPDSTRAKTFFSIVRKILHTAVALATKLDLGRIKAIVQTPQ